MFSKKAVTWKDMRKRAVKKACAIISGMINCKKAPSPRTSISVFLAMLRVGGRESATDGVQLVTEVDGVHVVAFEIREHDDLCSWRGKESN